MRKKLLVIGVVLLTIGGGFYLWYTCGILEPFNRWTAVRDMNQGRIQLVQVGYPGPDYPQVEHRARLFGYEIYPYGCNVSARALNGIQQYNEVMSNYLVKRNGKDFWTKVENTELPTARTSDHDDQLKQVIDLVQSQRRVIARAGYVDSASGGKRHLALMTEIMDSLRNIHRVKVVEYNGVNYAVHFTYTIDATAMKVLSDQTEDPTP